MGPSALGSRGINQPTREALATCSIQMGLFRGTASPEPTGRHLPGHPAPTTSQNSVELLGVFGLHQADPWTGTHCHLAPPHNSRPAAAVVPSPAVPLAPSPGRWGPPGLPVGPLPSEHSGLVPQPREASQTPPGRCFTEDCLSVSLLLDYRELLGTARPCPCTLSRRALSGTDPPRPAYSPDFLQSSRP